MRLVAFQVVSDLVSDVIRHVYESLKRAWLEEADIKGNEVALSPVANEEQYRRIGD